MVPEVSVVVTCYNYGQYISGCLSSIQAQTFENFEVIVVNDGSTDNSEESILPFLYDHRFTYILQKNGGQSRAKNRGIQEARGALIAFLDADDSWDYTKLEKQIKLFRNPDVSVVYSLSRLIDSEGNSKGVGNFSGYLSPRKGNVTKWLLYDNFVRFSSAIVRSECFETCGVFDESLLMGIDWDLWLRLSTKYDFDFVDEYLISYRIGHSGQMSKNITTRFDCADMIIEKFLLCSTDDVEKSDIKGAHYYTLCNRAAYYVTCDKKRSFCFILKALSLKPFSLRAYKEIVRMLISIVGMK